MCTRSSAIARAAARESFMDRNNGGDPLAPPRPPKAQQPQQPRVHQLQQQQQSNNSSSLHHRPRAPEPPLPNNKNMSEEQQQQHHHHSNHNNQVHHHHPHHPEEFLHRSSSSASSSSSIRRQQPPPPRPPTITVQQQSEPVLPLPPRVPLKPNVLHAVVNSATATTTTAASPSHPVQGAAAPPPTIAPLVPLQQQQQSSITFGRRSRASPAVQSSSSNSLSASASRGSSGGGNSSPSPNRNFNTNNQIGGVPPTQPQQLVGNNTLIRNLTNLSSNLISNLVNNSSSSPSTATTTAAGPGTVQDTVTLAVPRPENERLTNEYVDTPFIQQRQQATTGPLQVPSSQQQQHSTTPQLSLRQNSNTHHHHHLNSSRTNENALVVVTSQPTAASGHGPTARLLSDSIAMTTQGSPFGPRKQLLGRHVSDASEMVITKQPVIGGKNNNNISNSMHKKDLDLSTLHSIDKLDGAELSAHLIDGGVMGGGGGVGAGHHLATSSTIAGGNGQPSITCPQCEKCRCEGCQKPRQLPSRWLCDKSCLCSAESVLDYATCLCCVKALFYHCSKDHEIDNENGNSISCADDPCSCLPHRRTTRWSCLGALSLILPCLVCYWPMRGAISLCASCYANQSRKGCRCDQKSGAGGSGRRGPAGSQQQQQHHHQQHMPLQHHQQFGRDGPMRGGTGVGGGIPGQAKKVFPVDELEELATRRKKLHDEVVVVSKQQKQHVDCDMMSGEQDRLTARTGGSEMSGEERRIISACGVVSGGGGGGVVNGGCGSMVDSDSSSCGGGGQNLVRTLRLKPTSTSSTSSSQLSLLRHPADETPPRHLLD